MTRATLAMLSEYGGATAPPLAGDEALSERIAEALEQRARDAREAEYAPSRYFEGDAVIAACAQVTA